MRSSPRVVVALASLVLALFVGGSIGAQTAFSTTYVDRNYGGNGRPGWVLAGDVDGDRDFDLVAGGGNAMFVYENRGDASSWVKHGSLDGTREMGANGAALLDVDRDGDLDVVCAKYTKDLGWWENPGGPLRTRAWTYHRLDPGINGWYVHDLILVDIDGDGEAREIVVGLQRGYWNAPVLVKWFRPRSNPTALWEAYTIQPQRAGLNHCHSGMSLVDLDDDGDADLSFSDGWFEAPDDPRGTWTWHREITDVYGISNNVAADLNRDGRPDLVVAAGHHGDGVFWFEAPASPRTGTWRKHAIDASVPNPESLEIADVDFDGDLDVLSTELDFDRWSQQVHQLWLYENLGGSPPQWRKTNIAPNSFPNHQSRFVDVDFDGRLDVISEATGHSVISFHRNVSAVRPTTIVINEVLAENVAGDVDEAGEHEPWIEICNDGDWPFDLTGFGLAPGGSSPLRWQFPAGTLVPGRGFVRVWADTDVGQGPLHTDFRIDPAGGSVTFASPRGGSGGGPLVWDAVVWGQQVADRAFGRLPDGEAGLFHLWRPSGQAATFGASPFQGYDVRPQGSATGLELDAIGSGVAGETLTFSITGGAPSAPALLLFAPAPKRVDLGSLGVLSIELVPEWAVSFVLDAQGSARSVQSIPTGLRDALVCAQAWSPNTLSNAVAVRFR